VVKREIEVPEDLDREVIDRLGDRTTSVNEAYRWLIISKLRDMELEEQRAADE
jgi:nitrate reductase beta subunit